MWQVAAPLLEKCRHVWMIPINLYIWPERLLSDSDTFPSSLALATDQSFCHLQLGLLNTRLLVTLLLLIFYPIFSKQQPKPSSQLESYHVFICLRPFSGSASQQSKSQHPLTSTPKPLHHLTPSSILRLHFPPFCTPPLSAPQHFHFLSHNEINSAILFILYTPLQENRLYEDLWWLSSLLCPCVWRTQWLGTY